MLLFIILATASTLLIPVASGVAVAALTALAAMWISRRENSGNIDASPAEQLWTERRAMTEELRQELKDTKIELAACRVSLSAALAHVERLQERVNDLERRLVPHG